MAPKLTKAKVHKLQKLLFMEYKPAEIAAELGISADTIYRSYLPAGAPYKTDDEGRVWIVGTDFRRWAQDYLTTRQAKPKLAMADGQGYCLRCNLVIEMAGIRQQTPNKRGVANLTGTCPACGATVNRMVSTRPQA